jgi:tRNA-uridine 2-sulfurtransferase
MSGWCLVLATFLIFNHAIALILNSFKPIKRSHFTSDRRNRLSDDNVSLEIDRKERSEYLLTVMNKVVVGLSGGVDSSVAAATLHHQGYEVIGLTLWLMKGKGQCCSEGMVDAATICEQLNIPHHIVDSRDVFQTNIIDYLVSGYEAGVTPLPCSQCNRAVKFSPMLEYARKELGSDRIATGHYARIAYNEENGRYQLLRAIDRNKDQSYFLYDLTQELLAGSLFPLGNQTKEETRRLAAQFNLKTAEKPESQDLCLIEAHGSMQSFLDKYINQKEGEIVDLDGKVLGKHTGIHHYTIGQRKGIGVAAAEPLYVVKLDPVMNQVIVGNRDKAGRSECTIGRLNWVSITEPTTPIRTAVQVRYRSAPATVNAIPLGDSRVKLVFDLPQFGITPGQAAVLYDGDIVLGGGIIEQQEAI